MKEGRERGQLAWRHTIVAGVASSHRAGSLAPPPLVLLCWTMLRWWPLLLLTAPAWAFVGPPARFGARRTHLQASEQPESSTSKVLRRLTVDNVYRSPLPPQSGPPPPPYRSKIPLWRNLAAFAPYSLLAVPSLLGPERTSEIRDALGPVGDALAALGAALQSPLVRSKDVVDASGVAYDDAWAGTSGLALIVGLSLLQGLGNVGPRIISAGLAGRGRNATDAGPPT